MSKNAKFSEQKIWVNWKIVLRDGKKTKIPFQPDGTPADSTDPSTWHSYKDCKAHDEKVGFVLSDELSMVAIDLDKCLDLSDPESPSIDGSTPLGRKLQELVALADTYTEISPSGTGLHLLFKVPSPYPLIAMRSKQAPGFEVYARARYLTYTGNPFGAKKKIRLIEHEDLTKLLEIVGYPWGNSNPHIPTVIPILSLIPDAAQEILTRMFVSKNGADIRSLYDGNIPAKYNGDDSAADAALLAHLAYWTQKDPDIMRTLWLASPLGQREKTQKRIGYQDTSIRKAIQFCKDVYTPPPQADPELDLIFTVNKDGQRVYPLVFENICRILANHPDYADTLKLDTFRNVIEIKDGAGWRELQEVDAMYFQRRISVEFPPFIKVKREMVFDAMVTVAHENKYDSAIDYVRSVQWDGIQRLDHWLTHTYGVADDIYHQAVGSNWFKGMVKRILHPGCKFDHVLVLEGPQGTKKSTSLAVLGRSWHVETTMDPSNKDFFQQFQGKAIIEFSEGEIVSRVETKKLKAIITMQYDRYRPSYGRLTQDFPRRSVFAMTTNQEEYLKDESGNRRWLPVQCKQVANIEWLEKNRDQLFAEAAYRVDKGETIWEFPEEETKAIQESRRIGDPNTDAVVDWYMTQTDENIRNAGITVQQAYNGAILKQMTSYKPLAKWEEMSIATILKDVLKLRKDRPMRNGVRQYRYYPSDDTKFLLAETPRTEHIPSPLLSNF